MNKLIKKLFVNNVWTIGIRNISEDGSIPNDDGNKVRYQMYKVNDRYYYADPFVVQDDDNVYIFVEKMDRIRGIGTIAFTKYQSGKFGKFTEIIREPFHLSYPNVIRYKGDYYMIPESSANNEIRLYKAIEFPYKWKFEKSILTGKPYVDSSIVVKNDKLSIYTYYIDEKSVGVREKFVFDLLTNEIEKVADCQLLNERPAGNPIIIDGLEHCPLQDCSDYYGKGIILSKIEDNEEKKWKYLSPKTFEFDFNIKRITGTHTLNRSKNFEVIDIRYDKMLFTKQWLRLCNKLNRKKRK